MGGQLGPRGELGLVAEALVVQGDLRARLGNVGRGVGDGEQEDLLAEAADADARDLGEQLVAADREPTTDARREWVGGQVAVGGDHQPSSRPPTIPPKTPSRAAPELAAAGGW